LCFELIDDPFARDMPGDFTFNRYFTSVKAPNHLHDPNWASAPATERVGAPDCLAR
jgi:hypothetical protein